jgi:hypothetical protein
MNQKYFSARNVGSFEGCEMPHRGQFLKNKNHDRRSKIELV